MKMKLNFQFLLNPVLRMTLLIINLAQMMRQLLLCLVGGMGQEKGEEEYKVKAEVEVVVVDEVEVEDVDNPQIMEAVKVLKVEASLSLPFQYQLFPLLQLIKISRILVMISNHPGR